MKKPLCGIGVLSLLLAGNSLRAQEKRPPPAPPQRALARELLRELVEIDTTPTRGSIPG